MIALHRRRQSSKMSLTPLIDVVFILLIFFMLESDFLRPYVMELAQQGGGAQRGFEIDTHIDRITQRQDHLDQPSALRDECC